MEINNDISQRKRAEDALRQSESNLAEAQRLTHTGSFIWDVAQRDAIYVSDEWYRIYELEPGPIAWKKRLGQIHPDDRRLWEDAVERAIEDKSDYEVEYRVLLPNKVTKHLHVIAHPILSESGEAVRFMGTVTDVTDRKRAERERERLRQIEADLAHMNRVTTMGELTASLAHEINQPIAAAMTNASTAVRWLSAENPDIEEARAAATRIVKDADRAAQIISRLRSLFKKSTPQQEPVHINVVIHEIEVLLRSEASRYCVSIRKDLAAELPAVIGDRVQLQQVLMNLMMNSIDAMKGTDPLEKRELIVASRRDGDSQLIVSVHDTGQGLPADPARVFDAFYTTKPDGTGMGLAISRTIIEAHGGRLWSSSNPSGGATFSFTLPIHTNA
jgi:PAS domain S-box-containing protein